jgi:hypothetical protein
MYKCEKDACEEKGESKEQKKAVALEQTNKKGMCLQSTSRRRLCFHSTPLDPFVAPECACSSCLLMETKERQRKNSLTRVHCLGFIIWNLDPLVRVRKDGDLGLCAWCSLMRVLIWTSIQQDAKHKISAPGPCCMIPLYHTRHPYFPLPPLSPSLELCRMHPLSGQKKTK